MPGKGQTKRVDAGFVPGPSIAEMARMPFILLGGSTWCNLNCPYCSQSHVRTDSCSEAFFRHAGLQKLIARIPSAHLYLTGGEPLIQPRVKEFVVSAAQAGHVVSFDTNICLPLDRLRFYLEAWKEHPLGVFNISHHMVLGIPLDYILKRVALLRSYGRRLFVKYVGVPELLPQIKENLRQLHAEGIGTMVTVLQGQWKGRILPHDYTDQEIDRLLEMVSLGTHALQVFGGIKSKGMFCRGGNDFIVYNMSGDHKVIPCCHGGYHPIEMDRTYFNTGVKQRRACPMDVCVGDYMFINGINGCVDEIGTYAQICAGKTGLLGVKGSLDFITGLLQKGYELADAQRFCGFINARAGARHARRTVIGSIREYIDAGAALWKTSASVIAGNPDLAADLQSEQARLVEIGTGGQDMVRQLIKKAAQLRFGLPLKCNFEVISRCLLRCEFCVLADLDRHRRSVRMTIEEFFRIWQHMEFFTTEVEFLGGEPLMNKDLFAMIREARKTGVTATLTTNAQLMNAAVARQILDACPSRLLVAFDSVKKDHYETTRRNADFIRLRDNVRGLIEMKRQQGRLLPLVELQLVVTRKNVDEVLDFWRECIDMGADVAAIKPVLVWPESSTDSRRKMLREYLMPGHPLCYHSKDGAGDVAATRKPGCCPNAQTVHIGSGSEVVPCWYLPKHPFIAGYCADQPFLDIWFSPRYSRYRKAMRQAEVSKFCRRCIGEYKPGLFVRKQVESLRKAFAGGCSIAGVPLEEGAVSRERLEAINGYIDRGKIEMARAIVCEEYNREEKNIILSELLRIESQQQSLVY